MSQTLLDRAIAFHSALPHRIRRYLNGRCIPDGTIDAHLLGWTGRRISIPIRNRAGEVVFFKLRKDPEDTSSSPKMYALPGGRAEIYGWDRLVGSPERIIICEGEFDRLVLEACGFPAVTSTTGAGTFLTEWVPYFREIPEVYLCFDNDEAGRRGAVRVAALLPHARAVTWPPEIGESGDVTDYFVRLGKSVADFAELLKAARPLPRIIDTIQERQRTAPESRVSDIAVLKSRISIEAVIARYLTLRASGENRIASCPFHEDQTPSLVVFRKTQTFYCFGCRAHGDVLSFLMQVEHLTFREAVDVARRITR